MQKHTEEISMFVVCISCIVSTINLLLSCVECYHRRSCQQHTIFFSKKQLVKFVMYLQNGLWIKFMIIFIFIIIRAFAPFFLNSPLDHYHHIQNLVSQTIVYIPLNGYVSPYTGYKPIKINIQG